MKKIKKLLKETINKIKEHGYFAVAVTSVLASLVLYYNTIQGSVLFLVLVFFLFFLIKHKVIPTSSQAELLVLCTICNIIIFALSQRI